MAYRKPNVSRLTRAANIAAIQNRGLRGAPKTSGVRAMRVMRGGLGWSMGPTTPEEDALANMPSGGGTTVGTGGWGDLANTGWQDPFSTPGGIQTSSGGAGIGTGIMSALGGLFGSKSSTPGYVPTTSNTSTYLLIGGVVLGGILLVTLLK